MNIKRIKNLTATICLIFCAYFLPFFASVSAFSPGFKTITSTVPFLANTDIKKIDQLVSTTIESFSVPGVSIGIIKDEKTLHLKGYGQLNIETKTRINEESIFKVASNSKAFTSAALALFVEVGKLKWSDKVIQYLPEFKMEDLWVTKEFNIRDLLTHRIGLRVGAGYLMLWPEPTLFSRDDVINNLRYFQSVGSFRDESVYDNLLYIVAGQVIAEISGMSWEMFVEENIFKKLGMKKCFAGGVNTKNHTNLAAPHGIVEDSLILLQKNLMNNKTNLMAAAGGIKCSAKDLLTWVEMLLNLGKSNSSKKLLSEKQVKELWKPVTSLPISSNMRTYDKTDYRYYALGWRVSSYQGEHRVSHTGTLGGFMSQIIMFPTRKLGIVILTNQQSASARNALARNLMNIILNQLPDRRQKLDKDWLKYYIDVNNKSYTKSFVTSNVNKHSESRISNNKKLYLGGYEDSWFEKITFSEENDLIMFKSEISPRMIVKVYFHGEHINGGTTPWIKWNDRSFEADVWLFNSHNELGEPIITMKAISSKTDFSFDFQDLNFKKINRILSI